MDLAFLSKSELFLGLSQEEISQAIRCLQPAVRSYQRNEAILSAGDVTRAIGLLLRGTVCIVQEDFWGHSNILAHLNAGELFAETYACLTDLPLSVNVWADSPSEILFLNTQRLLTLCPSACQFHNRLIKNLLTIVCSKNMALTQKIQFIAPRSTREKVLSYLSAQARKNRSASFQIPFNRQQMADFLCVDRSALSAELGRMRRDGLIQFERNHFTLIAKDNSSL